MNIINIIKTHLRKYYMLPDILKKEQDTWEEFMKHLQKWFWLYSIGLILFGLTIDFGFNGAEIAGKEIETTLANKEVVKQIIYTYQPTSIIPKIISNLFYGLAASLLILFLVERRIAMEEVDILKEEVNRNIFSGVLKKVIPEQLFDKFNKDIFQTDLVRKNAFWTYEISKNQYNSFDIKQSIRYELHNLNDYEIKYKLPININTNTTYVDSKISNIEVLNSDKTKQVSFNQTDREVTIKGNDYIKITMIVDNVYKHTSVLDVHNSMFSIIGLTIKTIQPKDISVKITPSFLNELKIADTTELLNEYEPIDCILQGQGITYLIETKQQNSTLGENRIMNE